MGVRRRKEPPAPPPPPLGIVLDGSNVTASAHRSAPLRVRAAMAWCSSWGPGLPVVVFFDHATLRRFGEALAEDVLAAVRDAGGEARVAEPNSSADPLLLAFAAESRSLLVTNDRFWDFEDLRRDVITLQFVCEQETFRVYEEATWFLPSGAARRVGLDAIRPGATD